MPRCAMFAFSSDPWADTTWGYIPLDAVALVLLAVSPRHEFRVGVLRSSGVGRNRGSRLQASWAAYQLNTTLGRYLVLRRIVAAHHLLTVVTLSE